MTPAQLADRSAALRQHKAGNSRTARVTLPAPIGEVLCGAVESNGIVYCFTPGVTLAVAPDLVRWL